MNENNFETEVEVYILQDEDGNEHEFELIGTCEKNGVKYYAMIPADTQPSEEGVFEYVILKAEKDEDGEDILVTVDDEDEFDSVADYFDDLFSGEMDYDV